MKRLRNRDVLKFGDCVNEYVFKDSLDDETSKRYDRHRENSGELDESYEELGIDLAPRAYPEY